MPVSRVIWGGGERRAGGSARPVRVIDIVAGEGDCSSVAGIAAVAAADTGAVAAADTAAGLDRSPAAAAVRIAADSGRSIAPAGNRRLRRMVGARRAARTNRRTGRRHS